MAKLHELRIKVLEDVENGDFSLDKLKGKDYGKENVKQFKRSGLLLGKLNSLQLSKEGQLLLLRHKLNESISNLDETMEDFKKSSKEHSEEMIKHEKWMTRMTAAILVFTLINVGILIAQFFI